MATSRPNADIARPLQIASPDRLTAATKPNGTIETYSHELNFMANLAIGAASATRQNQPIKVPTKFAVIPARSAILTEKVVFGT